MPQHLLFCIEVFTSPIGQQCSLSAPGVLIEVLDREGPTCAPQAWHQLIELTALVNQGDAIQTEIVSFFQLCSTTCCRPSVHGICHSRSYLAYDVFRIIGFIALNCRDAILD